MTLRITVAGLFAAGLIAQPPPPRLVGVVNPATRPDLKLNAVLLTNNTAVACSDIKLLANGAPGAAGVQSHAEDPIGGLDGSFQLLMADQPVLGTDAKTRKVCSRPHDGGSWELHWRVFKLGGALACASGCSGTTQIQPTSKVVVNFSGGGSSVEISRVTDTAGTAWQALTPNSTFTSTGASKALTGSILRVHKLGAPSLRMSSLNVINGTTQTKINLPRPALFRTCAAFILCHDGLGCNVPVPDGCQLSRDRNPKDGGFDPGLQQK